ANSAGGEGGGVVASDPGGATGITLIGSTISGNLSGLNGGGIILEGGVHTLINSTISGNSAAVSGGGLENRGGTLTIRSSTFTDNRSDSDGDSDGSGGGIFLTNGLTSSQTTLHNTIVAGNHRGTPGADTADD